jgi:Tfp pilus assembly protein PilV
MPIRRSRTCPCRINARGAFLVEALVAILVFSIASAGLFLLLANALRESGNALARTAAAAVAASTIARMAAEDPATLADRYDAQRGGSGFRALLAAAQRLPGVSDTVNAPVVAVDPGPSIGSRRVSVTIHWQLPVESAAHRSSVSSVVAPR